MTGRELIIYIMMNHLEDEEIIQNGTIVGFMTVEEAAAKMDVGVATIEVWVALGHLKGVLIGDKIYIPANSESPLKGGLDARDT